MISVFSCAATNFMFIQHVQGVLTSPTSFPNSQDSNMCQDHNKSAELDTSIVSESIKWLILEMQSYISESNFDDEAFTVAALNIELDLENCINLQEELANQDENILQRLWFAHRMFRAMFVAAESLAFLRYSSNREKMFLRQAHIVNVQSFGLFDTFGFPNTSQVGYSLLVFALRKDLLCCERYFQAHSLKYGAKAAAEFETTLESAKKNLKILLGVIPPQSYPFFCEWEECGAKFA